KKRRLIPAFSASSSLHFVTSSINPDHPAQESFLEPEPFGPEPYSGQSFLELSEESVMTSNRPYDPISQMRLQMSLLSLAAALDRESAAAAAESSEGALLEAGELEELVTRYQ